MAVREALAFEPEPEDEQQRDRRDREQRSSEAHRDDDQSPERVVMANALDEFLRSTRKRPELLPYARLRETSALLQSIQSDVARLVDHKALRELLSEQAVWLEHAARAVKDVRALRDDDIRRFWPAMWKRWAVATALCVGVRLRLWFRLRMGEPAVSSRIGEFAITRPAAGLRRATRVDDVARGASTI